jgi:hypothetical protein
MDRHTVSGNVCPESLPSVPDGLPSYLSYVKMCFLTKLNSLIKDFMSVVSVIIFFSYGGLNAGLTLAGGHSPA